MSRTFKDRKELKVKRKKLFQPLWTKRFERNHYEGTDDNEELERCPKCQALTNFQNGFINCSMCDWGNYFPANGHREEEEQLEYKNVS
jgi:hypothetical protein